MLLGVAIWAAARSLAALFSIDDVGDWAFNPFAWQLVFVLGIVVRVHAVSEGFHAANAHA